LSGERGHFELLRGDTNGARLCLRAIVSSTNQGLMAPEQAWNAADIAVDEHGNRLAFGKGTKSATPLNWSHAAFLKLLRSLSDGAVFDLLPEVEQFARATDGDGGKIYDT
jgi:glucoamylase